jgi:rhodanese-related sulfurtransferase
MKKFFTLFFLLAGTLAWSQDLSSTDTIYRNITVVQADSLINANLANPDFMILDVRTAGEYNGGHLVNSVNINYYDPNFSTLIAALDHSKTYLVHCASGSRSAATFTMMQNQHFREVYNMLGGISAWISAGYPTTTTTGLADQSGEVRFRVFPNPAQDVLCVELETASDYHYQIIDAMGRIAADGVLINGNQRIPLSSLEAGSYIIVVFNGSVSGHCSLIKQ